VYFKVFHGLNVKSECEMDNHTWYVFE